MIHGEDSAKNVYGDLEQVYWVPYTHNIFIQVSLGRYIVTFKMM